MTTPGQVDPGAHDLRLFVGNVSAASTAVDVEAIFRTQGFDPTDIDLVRDRRTGRGICFLTLPSVAECERAIATMDLQPLHGHTLRVKRRRPKFTRANERHGMGRG